MPWNVRKGKNGKWLIVKKSTGKTVGKSDSKNMAMASIRARYSNEKSGKN